jgi:hypothetical protein
MWNTPKKKSVARKKKHNGNQEVHWLGKIMYEQ